MDDIRERFLRDRVLTATPAQRVVMLYDRLALDLARGRTEPAGTGEHLSHAGRIVAELLGSLDQSAGGPAANLAVLYGYLLRTILQAQLSGALDELPALESMVAALRESWAVVANGGPVAGSADTAPDARPAVLAGATGVTWSA